MTLLCLATGKPLWVSFTLEDSTAACLRDGQHLSDALQQLQGCINLAAVLVNCCASAAVTAALPVLRQHAPPGEPPRHKAADTYLVAVLATQARCQDNAFHSGSDRMLQHVRQLKCTHVCCVCRNEGRVLRKWVPDHHHSVVDGKG
jgi:hypothetical protein